MMSKLIDEFYAALFYLHMSELKKICKKFKLSNEGMKGELIERIMVFIKTGKQTVLQEIPEQAKAQKGITYPLLPSTYILSGAYKNDLRTRLFFKKLIGSHFHFTAFGQQWIKERWFSGKPPTYAEFAQFWQTEYLRRKNQKAQPKQEWAYLSFIQQHVEKNSGASRVVITAAWKKKRSEKLLFVNQFLSASKLQGYRKTCV